MMNKLSQAKPVNTTCNFCNNTGNTCCHEAIRTDNKVQAHIIDSQDQHYHDSADNHFFMLHCLLVSSDVVMPKGCEL